MAGKPKLDSKTRLSRVHPYPAMIADELAMELAARYVKPGTRVLDPFAGTGRTLLAAAHYGGTCFGMDVNPLAVLIAKAKAFDMGGIDIPALRGSSRIFRSKNFRELDLEQGRKVAWFSTGTRRELGQIVHWLNSGRVAASLLPLMAVLLSATVREASFCRKGQWKLHRMDRRNRQRQKVSAWSILDRRLISAARDKTAQSSLLGSASFHLGDSTRISQVRKHLRAKSIDLILTSPPYGDSKTTVSYGGLSSLSLGVLSHLRNLDIPFLNSAELDGRCLGGQYANQADRVIDVTRYWAGSQHSPAHFRVRSFLADLESSCENMDRMLAPRSRAVFVVSRRSVAGKRLYLDRFLTDTMSGKGFILESFKTRKLVGKNTPYLVDSRGASEDMRLTKTMREEIVASYVRGC